MITRRVFASCKNRYLMKLLISCVIGALCFLTEPSFATKVQRRRVPVPTKETLPYVAEELGAASYIESSDNDDDRNDSGSEASEKTVKVEEQQQQSVKQNRPPVARQNRPHVSAIPYKRLPRKLTAQVEQQDNSLDYKDYYGVFGKPGVDFPVLASIPVTKFSCKQVKNSNSGYYADLETNCQVFHVCDNGRKISFLCPNGTIFRQSHLICDWWFRVDCERSPELYEESAVHLVSDQLIYKERAEAIARAMQKALTDKQVTALPTSYMNFSTDTVYNNNFNSESGLPTRTQSTQTLSYLQLTTAMPIGSDSYQNINEHQILAETASFTGNNGKFPVSNNYYYFDYGNNHGKSSEILEKDAKGQKNTFVSNYTEAAVIVNNYTSDNTTPAPFQYETYYTTYTPIHSVEYQNNSSIPDHRFEIGTTNHPNNDQIFKHDHASRGRNLNDTIAVYFTSFNNGRNVAATATSQTLDKSTPSTTETKPAISDLVLSMSDGKIEYDSEYHNVDSPTVTALLTKMTKDAFSQLFSLKNEQSNNFTQNSDTEIKNDLKGEHSLGLVQSGNQASKEKEELIDKLKFKNSPDLRELAQVFSRALSAYLENPEQFRRVLSEVRPTEPPTERNTSNLINPYDEVLTFSDDLSAQNLDSSTSSSTEQSLTTYPANNNYNVADSVNSSDFSPQTRENESEVLRNPLLFAKEVNSIMSNGNFATYYPDSAEISQNETATSAINTEYYGDFQNFPTVSNFYSSSENNISNFSTESTEYPAFPTGTVFDDSHNQFGINNYITDNFNQNPISESTKHPNYGTITTRKIEDSFSPSVENEQLLITADTQSFVSKDNLLKYHYSNYENNLGSGKNENNKGDYSGTKYEQGAFYSKTRDNIDNNNIQYQNTINYLGNTNPTEYVEYSTINSLANKDTIIPTSNTAGQNIGSNSIFYKSSFITTTNQPSVANNHASDYSTPDNFVTHTYFVQTTIHPTLIADYQTKIPQFGERIVTETSNQKQLGGMKLADAMEEAKTNNTLRRQLVLLLVSDKSRKENKTIRDMKGKLLKALLKPGESNLIGNNYNEGNYYTNNFYNNYTNDNNRNFVDVISNNRNFSDSNLDYKNDKEFGNSHNIEKKDSNNFPEASKPSKVNDKIGVLQKNSSLSRLVQSSFTINNVSTKVPSVREAKVTTKVTSRHVHRKSTSRQEGTRTEISSAPVTPAALKSEPEKTDSEVPESDNRAVDLLKSLYTLATNWNR